MATNFALPEGYTAPPDYSVLNWLGSGQTSFVYLAEHPRHGRVALKLPRKELKNRPVLRRMFENEVQITLNLENPNVVGAIDGYPTGERAFLVLEYCSGGTLDQRLLERGKLPLEVAYNVVGDVARGLAYSHSRSVMHRDVKPANVFLTSVDRAKLGDFGTGIFMSDASNERVGTAFYMAPEIFNGESASVKSDIYSLGILAYEVLTGARPFEGDSFEALMMAHLSGIPKPLGHYRSDLSGAMSRVIMSAMARDPERRYADVAQFIADFEKVLGRVAPKETPQAVPEAPKVGRASRAGARVSPPTPVEPDERAREHEDKKPRRGLGRWFGRKKS